MLRTYLVRNLMSYFINHLVGHIVLFIYGYLYYSNISNMRKSYDILHSLSDTYSFLGAFVILLLFVVQAIKGYLLYFPSTYLFFDDQGISFRKFKKQFIFIKWNEIEIINLKIENEWLLNLHIEKKDGKNVRIILSELWILSFARKLCNNHNFLKLMVIANGNPNLLKKLDKEQVEDLYMFCNITLPTT